MNSRERVQRAIHFRGPDRVPHYLPDGQGNDLLWLWIERPPDIQEWTWIGGRRRRIDAWGVVWESASEGSFGEAKKWPVEDITRQAEVPFPDNNNPRYYARSAELVRENEASADPKYCLGVVPFSSLNEG